jgi:hypothetical protein
MDFRPVLIAGVVLPANTTLLCSIEFGPKACLSLRTWHFYSAQVEVRRRVGVSGMGRNPAGGAHIKVAAPHTTHKMRLMSII